jgi:hypothetical protein
VGRAAEPEILSLKFAGDMAFFAASCVCASNDEKVERRRL